MLMTNVLNDTERERVLSRPGQMTHGSNQRRTETLGSKKQCSGIREKQRHNGAADITTSSSKRNKPIMPGSHMKAGEERRSRRGSTADKLC